MSTKRKLSDVWHFFIKDNEESAFAICKLCNKKLSRGGKSHTTSNLNKHLQSSHKTEFMKFKLQKCGTNVGLDEGLDVDDPPIPLDVPGPSSAGVSWPRPATPLNINIPSPCSTLGTSPEAILSSSPRDQSLKQPTLSTFMKRKEKFRNDDLKARAITRKISEMICLDNQPLSVVEDKGFVRLINHLEPRYEIPKRKYFATVEIPKLYDQTKLAVYELVQCAEYISITTDMWTSTSNDDYMGVTAHFFTDSEWKHVCLECIPFPEVRHSAEAIGDFLKEVFNKWNISAKIHVVVRDNASNVKAAMTLGNFIGIPCLAHTLQLVVKDGLLLHKNVQNLSSKCRRTVGHFKHSAQATKLLKAAQQVVGVKQHKLIQDEPTRWNSTKHMMDRLLEQRRAISYVAPELNKPIELTGSDWELMSNVVKLLKIFDDATFQVSSAQTTISEVIPIVNSAKKELETFKSTPGLVTFTRDLIESLNTRYDTLEEVKEYTLATLLDPRLKGSVFLSAESLQKAKDVLLQEAQMLNGAEVNQQQSAHTETQQSTLASNPNQSSTDRLKLKMFKRYAVLMEGAEKTATTAASTAEKEVAEYFNQPLASPSTNVCEYWMKENATFPRLSKLSLKYLSAPPATVFSERLFSTSGIICDRKRNRLDPERVQMLVFLNRNLQHHPKFY